MYHCYKLTTDIPMSDQKMFECKQCTFLYESIFKLCPLCEAPATFIPTSVSCHMCTFIHSNTDRCPLCQTPVPRAVSAPVNSVPADEALVDEALADMAPADDALVDEALADRAPADEALADRAPADRAPADRVLAENDSDSESDSDGEPEHKVVALVIVTRPRSSCLLHQVWFGGQSSCPYGCPPEYITEYIQQPIQASDPQIYTDADMVEHAEYWKECETKRAGKVVAEALDAGDLNHMTTLSEIVSDVKCSVCKTFLGLCDGDVDDSKEHDGDHKFTECDDLGCDVASSDRGKTIGHFPHGSMSDYHGMHYACFRNFIKNMKKVGELPCPLCNYNLLS